MSECVRPFFGGAGMGSKKVELFAAIRFDWQRNRMSIRSLARKYDVHRRTVRQDAFPIVYWGAPSPSQNPGCRGLRLVPAATSAGAFDGNRNDRYLAGDGEDEGAVLEPADGTIRRDPPLRVGQQ